MNSRHFWWLHQSAHLSLQVGVWSDGMLMDYLADQLVHWLTNQFSNILLDAVCRSISGSWRTLTWVVWPSSTPTSTSTPSPRSRTSSWWGTCWSPSPSTATRPTSKCSLLSARYVTLCACDSFRLHETPWVLKAPFVSAKKKKAPF